MTSDPLFGLQVSDGSLLQLKPERDLGGGLPRNNRIHLTYTLPFDPAVVRVDPLFVLQSHAAGRLDVAASTFDYGPLSLRPSSPKYAYTLDVPDGVHDLDVTTKAKWATTPAEAAYRVYGGRNSAPTGTWIAPVDGASVRIGTAFTVTFVLADADGDDVAYELYAAGAKVTYGTAAPGTVISLTYTPGVGPTSFSAILTDSLGATATIAGPTVTAIDNRPPLGSITEPATQRVREGRSLSVAFSVSDPENGPVNWKVLDNGITIASGDDISVASTVTFAWTPAAGVHALSLAMADSYGWIAPIVGPIVTVVAWRDSNIA